jgi:hypothetical protein
MTAEAEGYPTIEWDIFPGLILMKMEKLKRSNV